MSALIRYNRPTTLNSLIDDLFNNSIFERSDRVLDTNTWPSVDIAESNDHYTIHADLPGMDKKDISVTIENGTLTISGEKRKEKKEKEDGKFYHYERSYGAFKRSFNLPDDVNAEDIEASYQNGVLELALKKTKKTRPKEIEVKVK